MQSIGDAHDVIKELKKYIEPKRVHVLSSFFKTGKGEYGEGDVFIGITVPNNRLVARKFVSIYLEEVSVLLQSHIHEYRLCALLILVEKVKRLYTSQLSASIQKREHKQIVDMYCAHYEYINNWDLVDASAHHVLGSYVFRYSTDPTQILKKYAKASDLWQRRIAIIATFYGIQLYSRLEEGESLANSSLSKDTLLEPVFVIAEIVLADRRDLIQKAIGWMLREAGKRDKNRLVQFLSLHAENMPRTALRYAIEHFTEALRVRYMKAK